MQAPAAEWKYPGGAAPSRALGDAPGGAVIPTTRPERWLLLATIVLMPLEDHIPSVGGFSFAFVLFSVLAAAALLHGPQPLSRVAMHPLFIAAYLFIGLAGVMEATSPEPDYSDIVRFGLMVAGAILVATVCRDRPALEACFYGQMGSALWLGVIVILTSYGTLSGLEATDYDTASQMRVQAFKDMPVRGNLNGMAFTCTQGGLAALAFALAGEPRRRKWFIAIALFCLIASFFPMSRGGIAIAVVSYTVLLYAFGVNKGKALMLAARHLVSDGCVHGDIRRQDGSAGLLFGARA
jgi:hypothetical protein